MDKTVTRGSGVDVPVIVSSGPAAARIDNPQRMRVMLKLACLSLLILPLMPAEDRPALPDASYTMTIAHIEDGHIEFMAPIQFTVSGGHATGLGADAECTLALTRIGPAGMDAFDLTLTWPHGDRRIIVHAVSCGSVATQWWQGDADYQERPPSMLTGTALIMRVAPPGDLAHAALAMLTPDMTLRQIVGLLGRADDVGSGLIAFRYGFADGSKLFISGSDMDNPPMSMKTSRW